MKSLLHALALAALLPTLQAQAQTSPPSGSPPTGSIPSTSTPTLIGDTVTVTQYFPNLSTAGLSASVTVSSSVEISCPDSTIALCGSTSGSADGLLDGEYIDIGATTISGRFLASFSSGDGATFNGFSFTDLSFGSGYSGISGFTLTTNINGLTSDRISFTSSSLSINLLGLDPSDTSDGSGIGTFSVALTVSAVPEPAPAALLAVGLVVIAGQRRRNAARRTAAVTLN